MLDSNKINQQGMVVNPCNAQLMGLCSVGGNAGVVSNLTIQASKMLVKRIPIKKLGIDEASRVARQIKDKGTIIINDQDLLGYLWVLKY
jgi:hypothetical protein